MARSNTHATSRLVFGAALLLAMTWEETGLAQGGPPLLTDDPGTPGDGRWEVNLAFTSEKRARDWSFEAPLLDLNYGVGERIQLKFEVPWVVLHEHGEETRNGLGNSQVGVKWRFLDQETRQVDLSIYPQVEFNNPTSSAERGLVEEGTAWSFPLQLEKSFGELSINPEVGYLVVEDEDEWFYGVALGYSPLESFEMLAEVHGSAQSDFGDDELIAQVGCRWAVHPNLLLLGALGRGLREPEEGPLELVAYFGVQILFGRASGEAGDHPGSNDREAIPAVPSP